MYKKLICYIHHSVKLINHGKKIKKDNKADIDININRINIFFLF